MKRVTNIEYLKSIYPKYKEWNDGLDLTWINYNELCNIFEKFLFEHVLINRNFVKEILKYLNDGYVYSHCDVANYELEGVVEAYSIAHFLDRFHRFQVIYDILIREGLLPLRILPSDILDVGTGPANALISLNYIYRNLMDFGKVTNESRLQNFEYSIDYVELSDRFRSWLHRFCEFLMSYAEGPWNLPFHHGSYHNFEDVDFQKMKHELQQDLVERTMEEMDCSRGFAHWVVDNEKGGWKDTYKFNMIIFSNFLTNIETVEKFEKQLISASRALRNGGIILIVSSPGRVSEKYYKIFQKISKIFKKIPFMGLEYTSLDEENKYSSKDRYGARIDLMYQAFFTRLEDLEIDPKIYSIFKKKIFPDRVVPIDWKFLVYRKILQTPFKTT